jgi:hypothetical protein
MHPRLEELRKRLMEPVANGHSNPPRYVAPRRGGEVFGPATNRSQEPPNSDLESDDTAMNVGDRSSSDATPLVERPTATEEKQAKADGRRALETPQSLEGLARAVADLFEPVRQCQEHLAEIRAASESMGSLTRLAVDLYDPLKSFHGHIRKLSSSFESMRTFRDELAALAESFEPVRALHQEIAQLNQTVRTHLREVANGLEPAKALRAQIADLALAIDSVSDLQAQFYELSKAFGDPIEPN